MKRLRIGVDFDNTIVCYDDLLARLARERGLVPESAAVNKRAVRDYLRSCGREDDWTRLQGEAYGSRMGEAREFPGARCFFERAARRGAEVFIVSHKTRFPYRGPSVDLRAAAMHWLASNGFFDGPAGLVPERVYFEATVRAKAERIIELDCTHFIDDLPEFLAEVRFAASGLAILFDPHDDNRDCGARRVSAWGEAADLVLGGAEARP